MRHGVYGRKLNRDVKERRALFKSLVNALILRGKIRTTIAKAKAVQRLAEKLVTYAKTNSSATVRQLSSVLNSKETITKLTSDIAPRFADKLGGYVRIIRVGRRPGDNAEEAIIEWSIPEEKKAAKTKVIKEDKKQPKEPSKKAKK
jgi:large subunit ribosomal protein L17